jgi:tRNA A37 N6-isopentenylltransferase MiaA
LRFQGPLDLARYHAAMLRSQTTSAETLLARLRERHPEASDQELQEKLARIQRSREIMERIGERFAGVPQEEIEREAVKAVKEVRRERRERSSTRPPSLP